MMRFVWISIMDRIGRSQTPTMIYTGKKAWTDWRKCCIQKELLHFGVLHIRKISNSFSAAFSVMYAQKQSPGKRGRMIIFISQLTQRWVSHNGGTGFIFHVPI